MDGPGGTGKTFLYNTLLAYFTTKEKHSIAVASSGIASLLLHNGSTAHSRFRIPVKIHEDSICNINAQSKEAEILRDTKLIIWDEAPMAHKHCFESVDRLLRDVMKKIDPRYSLIPFGGKIVIFGGDFRQCLPVVIRGHRADIINSSIKSSYIWRYVKEFKLKQNMRLSFDTTNYSQYILNIGNGSEPTLKIDDHDDFISVPDKIWMPLDPKQLFEKVFDNFLSHYTDSEYIYKRAILCPLNSQAEEINKLATELVPGLSKIYLSIDSITDNKHNNNYFTLEYLNSLNISGLPEHKLDLKINQPIILMRNLSHSDGLCNGTRLIITGI